MASLGAAELAGGGRPGHRRRHRRARVLPLDRGRQLRVAPRVHRSLRAVRPGPDTEAERGAGRVVRAPRRPAGVIPSRLLPDRPAATAAVTGVLALLFLGAILVR